MAMIIIIMIMGETSGDCYIVIIIIIKNKSAIYMMLPRIVYILEEKTKINVPAICN